jgi:hypothetical protein
MINSQELKLLQFEPFNANTSDFYTTHRRYLGLLIIEITTDLEINSQTVEIGIADSWHKCSNIKTHKELQLLINLLK